MYGIHGKDGFLESLFLTAPPDNLGKRAERELKARWCIRRYLDPGDTRVSGIFGQILGLEGPFSMPHLGRLRYPPEAGALRVR